MLSLCYEMVHRGKLSLRLIQSFSFEQGNADCPLCASEVDYLTRTSGSDTNRPSYVIEIPNKVAATGLGGRGILNSMQSSYG